MFLDIISSQSHSACFFFRVWNRKSLFYGLYNNCGNGLDKETRKYIIKLLNVLAIVAKPVHYRYFSVWRGKASISSVTEF